MSKKYLIVMQERYKRLGKNTILVFIGNAGSKLIGLLMLPFYTHFLTKSEFGVSDLIATYASIILGIFTCCISDAIFIFPKNSDDEGRKKYFSSGVIFLLCSFSLYALLTFIVDLLSSEFHWSGTLFSILWWIFIFNISNYFQVYTQQFTRSIDRMKVYSITGIVHTSSMAITAFLLLPSYGLNGYLWSIVLSNIIAGLFSLIASGAWRFFSVKQIDVNSLKQLLAYGIPLIPNGLMWWLVNGLNRPIMESQLGLESIGVYSVANRFPSIINMLFVIFSNAWTISMLEEFSKPDFNAFFNKTIKSLYFIIVVGSCVLAVCSKLIVFVFADAQYFEAWRYIPLLVLGVIMQCLSSLIGGVFSAEKKSKYFFYSSIWGAVASVLLTWPCINFFGLTGVPIAVSVSFLVMVIVRLKYAWKHINMFDVKYFSLVSLLYVFLCSVIMLDINNLISIGSTLLVITIIVIISRTELLSLIRNIGLKI